MHLTSCVALILFVCAVYAELRVSWWRPLAWQVPTPLQLNARAQVMVCSKKRSTEKVQLESSLPAGSYIHFQSVYVYTEKTKSLYCHHFRIEFTSAKSHLRWTQRRVRLRLKGYRFFLGFLRRLKSPWISLQPPSEPKTRPPVSTAHDAAEKAPTQDQIQAWRNEASKQRQLADEAVQKSKSSYIEGHHAEAKHFSQQAKEYRLLMQKWNQRASDAVFALQNRPLGPYEMDLHGLFKQEALERLQQRLNELNGNRVPGRTVLTVITGKGQHSGVGGPQLQPAVMMWLKLNGYVYERDPQNAGRLLIRLID